MQAQLEQLKSHWTRDKGLWSEQQKLLMDDLGVLKSKHADEKQAADALMKERDELKRALEDATGEHMNYRGRVRLLSMKKKNSSARSFPLLVCLIPYSTS